MTELDGEQDAGEPPEEARTRLMREVAEQMDAIEAEFGEDFRIGRVITVVEVIGPDENVELRVRADQYPWVALGMLQTAVNMVQSGGSG